MKANEVIKVIKNYVAEPKVIDERRATASTDLARYRDALQTLRDKDIRHVSSITGVDLGEKIAIVYQLDCGRSLLNLRVLVPKKDPRLRTVTDIFPGAVLYEREVMEMFGVAFDGHPDPRRLFLPDDWEEGYPLRKEWKK
jgi:NADH:ubiquinone oxidoreductase subunit C